MFEGIKNNLYYRLWKKIIKKYNITDNCVVLALADENEKVDDVAIKRLPDYRNKRYAESMFVIIPTNYGRIIEIDGTIIKLPWNKIRNLYKLYCFTNYFDNLVFTFVNTPKDNNLGQYLKKSDVTEEDIVCLALYRLGKV